VFGPAWTLAVALALQSAGVQATPRTDRPLTGLFSNLAKDMRAVPSIDTANWLALGSAGALAGYDSDARISNWSARSGKPSYTRAGSVLGNGWIQSGGAIATYAAGRLAGKPEVAHVGSDLIRAQALNGLVTNAIKVAVNRQRPSGGIHSFPSGHTSATFASAAVLQAHYGWKAGAPAFATASFVGWTRIRDRRHWLSDVAFGAAIGVISGRTVARTHGPRRVTMVPAKTRGGFSVTFFVNN